MGLVNRSLLIVRPKQPFLDWLQQLPEPIEDATLDGLRAGECAAYLIPGLESREEVEPLVDQIFEGLFADQLFGWWEDESDHPTERTLAMFKEWFDTEWHPMIIDIVDGPLEVLEDDEDDEEAHEVEH